MLIKTLFMKLLTLLGSGERFMAYIAIILFYSITMIIRIFWSPIEFLMWFMAAVIIYISIKIHLPSNLYSRLKGIQNKINNQKYEQALKEIDEILINYIPKLEGTEKDKYYSKYILAKANCLWRIGFLKADSEKLKQSIEIYDELLEKNLTQYTKNSISDAFTNLGISYLHLGRLETDEELLDNAVYYFNEALKSAKGKNTLSLLHTHLGHAYELLSIHDSKEINLKKSLEEFEYSFEISPQEDISNMSLLMQLSFVDVLRNLYEITDDEKYKVKAIDIASKCITASTKLIDKYTKYFFPNTYMFVKFSIGKSYFQLFKLNNSQEDLKNCKEALDNSLKYCHKENFYYYFAETTNTLKDLNT